jgi:hypothetical protein
MFLNPCRQKIWKSNLQLSIADPFKDIIMKTFNFLFFRTTYNGINLVSIVLIGMWPETYKMCSKLQKMQSVGM